MITIKATLTVNEETLKRIYADGCDMDVSEVEFDDAFRNEMAWIQESGISLNDYEVESGLPTEPKRHFTGYCDLEGENIYVGDRCEIPLFDLEKGPMQYVADIIFDRNDFFATNVDIKDADTDYVFCIPMCELNTEFEVLLASKPE